MSAQVLINPRVCDRNELSELSDETRAFCERVEGLKGRDLFKAWVLENLRRTNQPPVAALELFDRVGEGNPVRPGHVDLDASGSFDLEGSVEHYTFLLFDAETEEVLAGPVFTREPLASLVIHRELPARLRATVSIEDDEGEIDTTEVSFEGPDVTASTVLFTCSGTEPTECQPTAANTEFTTDQLLEAAQKIDARITKATPLVIYGIGGGGGRGADWAANLGGRGGASGQAILGITLADLDAAFGSSPATTYCYGFGRQGWFSGRNPGSGGASTILRTCENVSQSETTGVILIAGGGGGGAVQNNAGGGGAGGRAFSTLEGDCPPSCAAGSSPLGQGDTGGDGGGEGGSQGQGGTGGNGTTGDPGADGIGGKGGTAHHAGPAGWTQGDSKVTGSTGSGGLANASYSGGAGGGGYGGGGSGGASGGASGGGGGPCHPSPPRPGRDLSVVL
ncbi:MAG: hypothetical protein AAF637_07720 [Pseudomonadota bacterium]